MVMTVAELVEHLRTPTTKVAVKRLYDYMKGKTHEMGVTIRVIPVGADPKYHVWHMHYNTAHKGDDPDIVAHFKAGHRKTDPQGFDLPKHDAYAIYFEFMLLYPRKTAKALYPVNKQSKAEEDIANWKAVDAEPWTKWGVSRITQQRVADLINGGNTRLLKTVYVSKLYDLAFWDQDAWNLMLDHVTG